MPARLLLTIEQMLHQFMSATGLESLARHIQGQSPPPCAGSPQHAALCAPFGSAVMLEHFMAELVALGLCLLAMATAGSLAVAFIDLLTKALPPIGSNRVDALTPNDGSSRPDSEGLEA